MRKGRQSIHGKNWHSNGEGVNLDTLFLRGIIDTDLYYRYLREYSLLRAMEEGGTPL